MTDLGACFEESDFRDVATYIQSGNVVDLEILRTNPHSGRCPACSGDGAAFRLGASSTLADVYALGVTTYRLVNGDAYLPDPASLAGSLEEATTSGAYPNRNRHRAYVPKPVRSLLSKAMAIDPTGRFQSAAELRHALWRRHSRSFRGLRFRRRQRQLGRQVIHAKLECRGRAAWRPIRLLRQEVATR